MFGRLEMDACIAAYSELMKARFDSAKLRSAVNDVMASSGTPLTDAFNDGQARGCHT